MDAGPNPNPVTASTHVSTQWGAPTSAQTSNPVNPTTIKLAPNKAVRRNPPLTSTRPAMTPYPPHVSDAGVPTPAAAATPPPRPPCTYNGTYVSNDRKPNPNNKLASIDG